MELCQLNVDDVLVQENHGGFWVVEESTAIGHPLGVTVRNRKTGDTRNLIGFSIPGAYVEVMRGNRTIWRRSGGNR